MQKRSRCSITLKAQTFHALIIVTPDESLDRIASAVVVNIYIVFCVLTGLQWCARALFLCGHLKTC